MHTRKVLLALCLPLAAFLIFLPAACSPPVPIQLGFVGGISGKVADLGGGGRNGAQLAVELRNESGGINGHPVELIIRDDGQDPEAAERVTRELIGKGVAAIIGPMTSAIAVRIVPLANQSKVLLMSPTVTTHSLSGKDDYFFRVVSSTREHASKAGRYQRGLRRVAAVYDQGNGAYTESWLQDYRDALVQAGGTLVQAFGFKSGGDAPFLPVAREVLATHPDAVLIIANAVDAALLCQQLRKLDAHVQIIIAEWGATERLVELGGKAVEGALATQLFDRESQAPEYHSFRQRYKQRFGQEPGFAGTAGFDAANVVLDALAKRQAGQDLKETVLTVRRFEGVQNPLSFDDFGDTRREPIITVVRDGQFVKIE